MSSKFTNSQPTIELKVNSPTADIWLNPDVEADIFATKTELSSVENKIPAEYVKSAAVADNKLTLTKQDNTVVEFEGGSYTLPVASPTTLGGVKVDGTSITIADGVISTDLPTKTSDLTNDSGFITNEYHDITKQDKLVAGDNITISGNVISSTGGSYTLPVASTTTLGGVKPDETTTTVDEDGTIHAHDTTPVATTTTVGSVKPDGTTITIDSNGVITANIPTKTSDLTNDSNFITTDYHDSTKQNVLVAGDNITISGNVISATGGGEPDAYIKEASVSGNTLTLTKKDNSTVAFTPEGGGGGLQNLVDGTGEGSVQGFYGSATGQGSFCMGYNTQAKAYASLAFGYASTVSAASLYGITLGYGNENDGRDTVSIGYVNKAHGNNSIAIGRDNKAYSRGGSYQGTNIAIGNNCIAGLDETGTIMGAYCIATGSETRSTGSSSFAEGSATKAYGGYGSHSEGRGTISTHMAQHAQGAYNLKDTSTEVWYNKGTYADIVGNGNSDTERSNAYTLDWQGNGTFAGTVSSATGADYAEYFEWKDGNLNNEDRVGYIVCLDGDKIVKANTGDDILGICSGTAMVLGDSAEWNWSKRYLTDDFGRIIYEDYNVEHEERKNEETGEVIEEAWTEHIYAPKQNPDYDASQPYAKRADRPEWQIVGMMGKLYVRDDGSCVVNGYADVKDGIATKATGKTNMRVMARVNENIIRVLLK